MGLRVGTGLIMDRELTFGEKAVGLTFNPSGDETTRPPTESEIGELEFAENQE